MNSDLLRFDNTKKIFIFDFETFNLNLSFQINRPWQIGGALVQGNKILKTINRYIKWKNCDLRISPEAAAVTHYNQDLFDRECIDSDIVFDEVKDLFINSDYLLAHNGLGFDIHLLKEWFLSKNMNFGNIPDKMIDTHCLAKGMKMGIPYKKGEDLLLYQLKIQSKRVKGLKTILISLGKEFNINHDYETLHDALSDILLNKKVWDVLKYQIEI